MKKNIYIFCLVIVLNSTLFSQSNWMFREPYPTANNLNSVFFINDSKGWIAGDNGTVLKYDSASSNPQFIQRYITSDPLNSIFFISENTGWTAGGNGKIFKTTDGGINWFAQNSSTLNLLTSMRFATPDTGWAVGINGTILKTVNGGNSWSPQQSSFSDTLKSCFCVSPLKCYAAGKDGTILFTSDGGSTWYQQSTGIFNFLNSLHFINQNTGWAVGNEGRILKTTNGGVFWDIVPSLSENCYSVFFKSSDTGTIATVDKLYSTTNGGQIWSEFQVIAFSDFFKSLYITDSFQLSVGNYGQIYKSTNAGMNWFEQTTFPGFYCNNQYTNIFFSGTTGWILQNRGGRLGCDQGNILRSTNGGLNWTNQLTIFGEYFTSISASGSNYWAVSIYGALVSNGVMIQTDAGSLYSIATQFACGSNGTILRISGAGASTTVTLLNSNTSETLYGISNIGSNMVYAAGTNGTIVRSTNLGIDWSVIPTGTNATLYSIKMGSVVGYAAGDNGTILKTTDAGENWTALNSGVTGSLRSVAFLTSNPSTAYIAGQQGIILKTTNEGDTWSSEYIGSSILTSIFLRNSSTGFITGSAAGRSLLLNNSSLNSNVKNLSLKILIEGFYNNISNYMVSDSVKIYLRKSSPPYSIADSSSGVISNAGEADLSFINATNQGYYIDAKQRNSIETWSSAPVMFNASSVAYDFTSSRTRAYGNNLTLKGSRWTVFSGDVNNDGIVDLTDAINVYNDGLAGLTGYIITDLNGDNVVDLSDLLICFNNVGKFVIVVKP